MQIDYVGIAEMLLESFEGAHPEVLLFDSAEEQTPDEVARLMQEYLDVAVIEELAETKVGRGTLLGIVSSYKLLLEGGGEGEDA
jgi:hypothetical protein